MLSPAAERRLHAILNDTIVLMTRKRGQQHLARFVDRTAQDETRAVVDILFADAHQVRIWGDSRSMPSIFRARILLFRT